MNIQSYLNIATSVLFEAIFHISESWQECATKLIELPHQTKIGRTKIAVHLWLLHMKGNTVNFNSKKKIFNLPNLLLLFEVQGIIIWLYLIHDAKAPRRIQSYNYWHNSRQHLEKTKNSNQSLNSRLDSWEYTSSIQCRIQAYRTVMYSISVTLFNLSFNLFVYICIKTKILLYCLGILVSWQSPSKAPQGKFWSGS